LLATQPIDEMWILEATHAMIDALRSQDVEGTSHVLGRALLAGMGDGPEPELAGPRIGLLEQLGRPILL
jgi:hypothetical protein